MSNPGLKPWDLLAALNAFEQHETKAEAADALGIHRATFDNRLSQAQKAGREVLTAACAGEMDNIESLNHFWKIAKDEDGNGYSLFIKNPVSGETTSISDMVQDAISQALADGPPEYECRPETSGENLMVLDLSDVHFLKLCVETETGYTYNREVARHRVREGVKALLRMAKPFDVGHILFVLGNDILHTDNSRNTTTSGTPQDTDGTIFQGFRDAQAAMVGAIEECAKVARVDLMHVPSNHDWVLGWTLSQCLGAWFKQHPNVSASDYALSERHRKYFRYGSNLIGLSHGDGAKEEKLYALMVKEARSHIAECQNLYWVLHHFHSKDRKRRGVDVFVTEKDHGGMTAHHFGSHAPEGHGVQIEYVRSPSPPDGWHDRNGFVNRQGVEAFVFCPHDGQKVRLTEWF